MLDRSERSSKGLWQSIDLVLAEMEPRQATVTRVDGKTVWVRFIDEAATAPESQFGTTEVGSVKVGDSGVVTPMRGSAGYFIPLHQSRPVGRTTTGGTQLGDTNPANILPGAGTYTALGYGATVGEYHAIAVGVNAEATKNRSVAMGWGAEAAGVDAVAIGAVASATGEGGMAVGAYSSAVSGMAIGLGATGVLRGHAIGRGASAADASVALGQVADASGYVSTALGFGSIASAEGAIGIGYHTTAAGLGSRGTYSVGIGWAVKADGIQATAVGFQASAWTCSTALGTQTSARHLYATAIGLGATTIANYDGVIRANTLRVDPGNRTYSKLGLKSTDGKWYYIYFSGTTLTSNTSY